jgi:hypothetical protein
MLLGFLWGDGRLGKEESSFFEKKEAKNFSTWGWDGESFCFDIAMIWACQSVWGWRLIRQDLGLG